MGFFSIFKKKSSSTPRSSAQRSSSAPQRSSAQKVTTTQKVLTGAWGVARAAGKQVKKTARNVKANVDYAANHTERIFPIERKGFQKLGAYKPGSRDLKWTIARYQRDGYTLATAKAKNGYGENVVVLFAKYGKVAVKTHKPVKVSKTRKVRIPENLVANGKRFRKGGTFGDSKTDAMRFARRLKADHGLLTRVKKITVSGEPIYTVYYRSGAKKIKSYY